MHNGLPDEIVTPRLVLRAPRAADAADIYANINDWDVVSMIARPPWPYPRALADEFVANAIGHVIESGGEVIGAVGIARRDAAPNLGFWIGKRHWGNGLMTEAAAAYVGAFFDTTSRDETVYSSYLVENPASWRVQEKLGFIAVASCMLFNNARGVELPGMQTLLRRSEFEARFGTAKARP